MTPFALQPLLDHRKHREEVLQREMADLRQRLDLEQGRAADLCRTLVENGQRLGAMHRLGATACDLQMMVRYLAHLKDLVAQQEETVRRAVQRIERKRAQLIDAVKQRKVIEKLKEKAEAAHRKEISRKEMSLIDEIAISRYNRDRRAGGENA